MSESAIVAPFRGLWKRQSATSPEGKATSMLNAHCVTEGDLRPRYGYRTLSNRPEGVTTFFPRGFAYLQGYDADFDGLSEFVTVEKRDGTVRPYSVNLTTGVRTAITDGGTALSLPDGLYQGVAYDDRSYWINPSANTPLYRHRIGNLTSWDTLVDTAYVAPPVSPAFTVTPLPASNRNLNKGVGFDTITVSAPDGINGTPTTVTAAGVLEVSGPDDDNGVSHRTTTEITFAAEDWSQHGYIGVEVLAGVVYPIFERTNLSVEVKIGATWTALPTKELFNGTSTKVLIMARLRGVAGINAIVGIRFTIGGYVARGTNGLAYKVNPIKLAGSYLEATTSGVRLWDGTTGDGLEYAVRYCGAGGIAPLSAITRNSVNELAAAGELLVDYNVRLGGRLALSVPEADAGTYSHVEFLRQNQAKTKWHRIGIQPNSGTAKMTDVIEEHELADPPYTEVVLGSGGSTGSKPPFSTRGIVAVFYYRGRLVWLRKGGKDNISLSRVGEPEETFDKNNVPSLLDLGRPFDLSMSPDLTDEPIGGAEVGNGAIFVGGRGLYAMTGVVATEVESPARIPGSTGGCGRFAFSKCIIQGQPGLAVMDKSGSVWFVTVEGAFSGDASVRPVDLTFDLWKYAKTFLYDEQKGEFGMLDLSTVWMHWDEFGQTLWVGAGRRALVLRVAAEQPEWEPYEYALVNPGGSTTISACLDAGAYGSVASSLGDGAVAWSYLGNPFASDDQYAQTAAFGNGVLLLSDTLRISELQTEQSLNPGATLTSVKFILEHSRTGDLAVSLKSAKPRIAGVLGANLVGAPVAVPLTDATVELPLVTLPSVAQVSGGLLDCDLQYEQETWRDAWSLTANFTELGVVAGSSECVSNTLPPVTVPYVAATNTVTWEHNAENSTLGVYEPKVVSTGNVRFTVQWTGAGPVPDAVFLRVEGAVVASSAWMTPELVADNGLGSGQVTASGYVHSTGSKVFRVPLVAGFGTLDIPVYGKSSGMNRYWVPQEETTFSVQGTFSAVVVAPAPSSVRVDALLVRPCYEIVASTQETSGGIGWQFPVFTSDRQMLLFRTSGQIDEVEFNSTLGYYIEGSNRDGGRPMPEGHWRSRLNILERTRIKHVEIEERDSSGMTITVDGVEKSKPSGKRWAKFGVLSQGHQQEVGVKFSESTQSVKAMRVIYEMLNKRLTR